MKWEEILLNSFFRPALSYTKYTQRHSEKEGEGKEITTYQYPIHKNIHKNKLKCFK